jgi:hypothetical protein
MIVAGGVKEIFYPGVKIAAGPTIAAFVFLFPIALHSACERKWRKTGLWLVPALLAVAWEAKDHYAQHDDLFYLIGLFPLVYLFLGFATAVFGEAWLEGR